MTNAPEIRLDDAFRNRLATSLVKIRRQPINILVGAYAMTVATSASPGRPDITGPRSDRYGRYLIGAAVATTTDRDSGGK